MDALGSHLLRGGLDERPGRERTCRPQTPARHRAPGRAARDLHERAAAGLLERGDAGGEEHERLLGHRHRPRVERTQIGARELAAAERSAAWRGSR